MKKNLLRMAGITLAMTTLLVGCGATDSETSAQGEERNTLVVGFDAEYPPYGFMGDDGAYTGFDLEMAKLVCEALDWEYIPKPIDWSAKDMELNAGTIDCIWNGFSITPARENEYAWSSPYVDNAQVIVVPTESGITTLEEIAGLNVVVQAGSASAEAFNRDDLIEWRNSFASLSENKDYNTAFMNLESGAADAVAVDIGVANYQIDSREDGAYTIIEEAFFSEPYGIGFRLEDTQLRDIIDAEYMKLVEDGTYATLAEQFGIDASMLILGQ